MKITKKGGAVLWSEPAQFPGICWWFDYFFSFPDEKIWFRGWKEGGVGGAWSRDAHHVGRGTSSLWGDATIVQMTIVQILLVSNLLVPKPFHSSIWCTNKAAVLIPRWQKFGDKSLGQKTLGKLFQTFWKGQAFKTSFWGIEFSCLGRNQKYLKYGKKLSFGSYLVFVRPSYGVLL